jgi:MYXO-CTERM domain-containing protein
MTRAASTGLRALAIAVVVGWPAASWAREEFPDLVATTLEGAPPAHVPPCSVCHLGGKTAGTTVFTPFAWAMRLRGLEGSTSSVRTAIRKVQADGVDSDGDGVGDADEIIRGTDPNNAGVATDLQDPQLGCRVGGGGPASAAGLAAAAGALVLIRRRRRR